MPTAFSYLRFSSPQQAAGDSIRRQTEATRDWCDRHKATLDESLNLRDEGVSAFRGKHRENPDVHGLAAFLAAVKTGRVPAGSFLIVENLDRLSRESIVPAVNLFTGILLTGVKIVQLKPHEATFDAGADMTAVMLALVELSRGNSESKMKSERVGAAWRQKKKNAAKDGKPITRMTPGWIKCDGDKFTLDAKKAATVRRIFAMSRAGLGIGRISQTLNNEKVPVLGRTSFQGRALLWSVNVVYSVLTNRATYGEYQPHVGSRGPDRRPAGDPIAGYYPPVITKDEYDAVRGILSERGKSGRGRRGKHVNLFAGLMKDARSGGSLTCKHRKDRAPVLVPIEARTSRKAKWVTFMLKPFEEAIVSRLAEVKVDDIQPENGGTAQRVEVLSGKLAEVEALAAKWRAKMDNAELVDVVSEKLAELGTRRKAIAEELADAQREAASPIGEALGQARAATKDLTSDESRERYRSAIRRVVESVWVLMMPGNGIGDRWAVAQVWFRGGAHRDYLIGYRAGKGSDRETVVEPLEVEDARFTGAELPGDLDLRNPDHARRLEKALNRSLAERVA